MMRTRKHRELTCPIVLSSTILIENMATAHMEFAATQVAQCYDAFFAFGLEMCDQDALGMSIRMAIYLARQRNIASILPERYLSQGHPLFSTDVRGIPFRPPGGDDDRLLAQACDLVRRRLSTGSTSRGSRRETDPNLTENVGGG
jgi:hypothetical protein